MYDEFRQQEINKMCQEVINEVKAQEAVDKPLTLPQILFAGIAGYGGAVIVRYAFVHYITPLFQ